MGSEIEETVEDESKEEPAYEEVPGRISVLKVIPYKGYMVYIRHVDGDIPLIDDIFMYDFIFENQIYSNYIIMGPEKGKDKLTEDQVNQTAAMIFAGAVASINTLLGEEVSEENKAISEQLDGIVE